MRHVLEIGEAREPDCLSDLTDHLDAGGLGSVSAADDAQQEPRDLRAFAVERMRERIGRAERAMQRGLLEEGSRDVMAAAERLDRPVHVDRVAWMLDRHQLTIGRTGWDGGRHGCTRVYFGILVRSILVQPVVVAEAELPRRFVDAEPMQRVPYELVKTLRTRTGQSLARCKEALAASGGDLDAAECWLAGVPINELGNAPAAAAPAPARAPVLAPAPVASAAAPPLNGFTPTSSERGSAGTGTYDGGVLDSFMLFATPPSGFGAPPSGMGGGSTDMSIGLPTAPPATESGLDSGSLFAGLSVGSTPPSQRQSHSAHQGSNGFGNIIAPARAGSDIAITDAAHARIAAAAAAEATPAVAEATEARRALETAQREAAASDERRATLQVEAARSAAALADAERLESEAETALAAAETALSRARYHRGVCAREAEDRSDAANSAAEACSRLNADVLELTAREAEAAAAADRVRREAEARLRAEEEEIRRRARADDLRRRADELRRQADALNPHSSRSERSRPAVSASSSMSSLVSGGLSSGGLAGIADPPGLCGGGLGSPDTEGGGGAFGGGLLGGGASDAFGLSLCPGPNGSEAAAAGGASHARGYPTAGAGGIFGSLGGSSGTMSGRGVSADLESLLLGLKLDPPALDRLLSTLAEAEVDTIRALRLLTEIDYKELGVSIGMRRKLFHALEQQTALEQATATEQATALEQATSRDPLKQSIPSDGMSEGQAIAGGSSAAGDAATLLDGSSHTPAAPALSMALAEPMSTFLSEPGPSFLPQEASVLGSSQGSRGMPHAPTLSNPPAEPTSTFLPQEVTTLRSAEDAGNANGTPPWLQTAAASLDSPPAPPAARASTGRSSASPIASPQLLPSPLATVSSCSDHTATASAPHFAHLQNTPPSSSQPFLPASPLGSALSAPDQTAPPSAPSTLPFLPVGAAAIYRGQPVTVVTAHTDDPAGPYYAVRLADGSVRDVEDALEEATPEMLQLAMQKMQREMERLQGLEGGEVPATGRDVRSGVGMCGVGAGGAMNVPRGAGLEMGSGSTGQQDSLGAHSGGASCACNGESVEREEAVSGAGGGAASAFSFLSAPPLPTGVSSGALAADMFGGEEDGGTSAEAAAGTEQSMLPGSHGVGRAPGSSISAGGGAASAFSFMSG